MPFRDSIDKVVTSYFAAVNAAPFLYKGVRYPVKTLRVSPLLLRGFTCPAGCGGCCPTFSLDYLPAEQHPYTLNPRYVTLNNRKILVYSDKQDRRHEHHCANLKHEDGRCAIHGKQPFSCDFELIRFMHSQDHQRAGAATRLFGRGWQMLRVDEKRGALCTITPPTAESRADAVRKLRRLSQWCDHFKLAHRVDFIIRWAESGAEHPLVLPAPPSHSILSPE